VVKRLSQAGTPAATDDVAIVVETGIGDRRFGRAAERAFHPVRRRRPGTSCTAPAPWRARAQHGFVVRRVEHVGDQVGDLLGFDLGEAARRHRRRADADAGGDEGLLRIVRDAVLVDRDVGRPSAASASLPVMFLARRSTRKTWIRCGRKRCAGRALPPARGP
jgi:hypothetical protein